MIIAGSAGEGQLLCAKQLVAAAMELVLLVVPATYSTEIATSTLFSGADEKKNENIQHRVAPLDDVDLTFVEHTKGDLPLLVPGRVDSSVINCCWR